MKKLILLFLFSSPLFLWSADDYTDPDFERIQAIREKFEILLEDVDVLSVEKTFRWVNVHYRYKIPVIEIEFNEEMSKFLIENEFYSTGSSPEFIIALWPYLYQEGSQITYLVLLKYMGNCRELHRMNLDDSFPFSKNFDLMKWEEKKGEYISNMYKCAPLFFTAKKQSKGIVYNKELLKNLDHELQNND